MSNNQPHVEIPKNTSRYNPYTELDRGLFLVGDNAARIASARWMGEGDVVGGGILRFKVEMFNDIPKTEEDFTTMSMGIGEHEYTCLTRNPCDNPVVLEGFAIQHVIKSKPAPTPEEIEAHLNQTRQILKKSTGAGIELAIQTYLIFESTSATPLTLVDANIEYTATKDGQQITGAIQPPLDKVRPTYLVMEDIRKKVGG